MSLISVRAELKTILESLTSIQEVYDYMEADPQQYPVAMVILAPTGTNEVVFDQQYNDLTSAWIIRVVFPVENTESLETKKVTLMDEILDKLRDSANYDTLNGVVNRFVVTNINDIEFENTSSPISGFDITIQTGKLKPIT